MIYIYNEINFLNLKLYLSLKLLPKQDTSIFSTLNLEVTPRKFSSMPPTLNGNRRNKR